MPDRTGLNEAYESESEGDSATRILSEEEHRHDYYELLLSRVRAVFPSGGRLLEIGCGTGGFLKRLSEQGWECEGIEPSPRLSTTAADRLGNSATIHTCHLEQAETVLEKKRYHAIVAIDVLEHIADPWILPGSAFQWLVPGGILFLQTPNARSIRRYIQRNRWEQLAPGEHLFLHTKQSLAVLLDQCGFSEIGIRSISGGSTDGPVRYRLMRVVEKVLDWGNGGNGLWATARRGNP